LPHFIVYCERRVRPSGIFLDHAGSKRTNWDKLFTERVVDEIYLARSHAIGGAHFGWRETCVHLDPVNYVPNAFDGLC
jgi:hypothetical protein